MRRLVLRTTLVAAFAAVLLPPAAAWAQFPDRPIRFLVGFAPGGPTDLSARAIAAVAARYLEQVVAVVNVPGAAGALAMNELVKAAPDGHTVAMMTTSYKALVTHQQKPAFDPAELRTLLGYAEFRQLLFVRSDSPYVRFEDLIALGRANPGAIKFGHSGTGTSIHLQGLVFFRAAGIDAPDVPFKGSSDYLNAVLGGHLPAGVIDIAGVRSHIRAGTVKPVVVFVEQRFAELPDVPTAREKGYAGLEVFNPQVAIMIRRGTAADRVQKLHDAFRRAAEDAEFLKSVGDMGLKGGYIAPETVDDTIARAEARAIPLLKELKLYVP